MRNSILFLILFYLIWPAAGVTQPRQTDARTLKEVKVVFYNTGYLFDASNDKTSADDNILPPVWTKERYLKKVFQTGKILTAIDSLNLPPLIGLSGIENAKVLKQLIKYPGLKRGAYKYIHTEGKDPKGLDPAMLYSTGQFRPTRQQLYVPDQADYSGKGILYAEMVHIPTGDTIHVFVNQWNTRYDADTSVVSRNLEAKTLKTLTDNIFAARMNAAILLLGDFNEPPNGKTLTSQLQSNRFAPPLHIKTFYNFFYKNLDKHEVTYLGVPPRLTDQILVSTWLATSRGLRMKTPDGFIFKPEWLSLKPEIENLHGVDTQVHLPVYIILGYR